MTKTRLVFLAVAAVFLGGCESDGATYSIKGTEQALSIVRQKSSPWSPWELAVGIRNDPVCQRRHHMRDVNGNTKIELYQAAPGAYVLRQGKRWYVTELKSCGFEQYKEEPEQPGSVIGNFLTRDDVYVFEAEKAEDKAGGTTENKAKAPAGGG